MAAPRRVIEVAFTEEELADLERVSRSRTEPASHVQRARILLTYRRTPSLYATGREVGVTHQTVERCLRRAQTFGVKAALKDSPRPGREPTITNEAKMFVLDLACRKAKDLGYPHEVWTTRLLAEHVRERAPAVGYACLAHLAQGTLCKILAAQEVKPHKVRGYLERRDPDFDEKMAEVLSVYREVEQLKQAAERQDGEPPAVAIISYDEKPGIQALATKSPDLPPVPMRHPTFARDHEYVRMGTLSLLAGIDLVTGVVHASVEKRHRSREFVADLSASTPPTRRRPRSRSFSTITPPTNPRKPGLGSPSDPKDASPSYSRPSTAPGSTSSRASSPSSPDPCFATSASPRRRNCARESWTPSIASTADRSFTRGNGE